ncbi:MAG: iron-containing alcohol dehydrogenase [Desulfurococcaceae archaeon]
MSKPSTFSFRYQDTILYFGENALTKASWFIKQYRKVGLITGKQSAKISGALDDVLKLLNEHGVEYVVYNDISPNPWASQAERAGKLMWEEGVEAIIAIGGGSVIDVAKVASLIAIGGRNVKALVKGYRPRRTLPLLAINITHGTGTEVDRYAVVTLDDNLEKHGLAIKYPDVSIDDPRYTTTLPRDQTIYTSFDAFYHSFEAGTATVRNYFVQALAYDSINTIVSYLPRLLGELQNVELRARLLYASMIAGIAIDNGSTHLNHAIEHTLSGLQPKLPHGLGLIITGPRFIYHTYRALPAESALLLKPLDPSLKPVSEDAEKASRVVKSFQESLGLTQRLGDYGFTENDVDKVVEYLMRGGLRYLHGNTPFPVTEDLIKDIVLNSL